MWMIEHEEAFEMNRFYIASIMLRQRITVDCTPHAPLYEHFNHKMDQEFGCNVHAVALALGWPKNWHSEVSVRRSGQYAVRCSNCKSVKSPIRHGLRSLIGNI